MLNIFLNILVVISIILSAAGLYFLIGKICDMLEYCQDDGIIRTIEYTDFPAETEKDRSDPVIRGVTEEVWENGLAGYNLLYMEEAAVNNAENRSRRQHEGHKRTRLPFGITE